VATEFGAEVQPDDIEPTKVSRNWRIIIKKFSPAAA